MNKVRHAGYLLEVEEDKCKKRWCVIRNKSFVIYSSQETLQDYPLDVSNTPNWVLPVSHLSATAYVLPANTRTPTQFSLELDCAQSEKRFTFYSDQKMTLEKWVDAIRAELTSDNVTTQDSPHGALLPPDVDFDDFAHVEVLDEFSPLSISSHGQNVLSKRSLDQIKSSRNFDQSSEYEKNNSPQFTEEANMKVFKGTANTFFSDVMQAYYRDDVTRSSTPLSSTAASSPSSSRHHTYQDSADESSLSSSTTSSPIITKSRKLRNSLGRQRAVNSMHTRSHSNPPPLTKEDVSLLKTRRLLDNFRDESSNTSGIEDEGKSSHPYFYTGKEALKNIKSTPGMRHVKKSSDPKRYTISELSQLDKERTSDLANKDVGKSNQQPNSKELRRSIAPISRLDLQLSQKRQNNRQRFSALPDKVSFDEFKEKSQTAFESTSDEEETVNSRAQDKTSPENMNFSLVRTNYRVNGAKSRDLSSATLTTSSPVIPRINIEKIDTPPSLFKPNVISAGLSSSCDQIHLRTNSDKPGSKDNRRFSGNFGSRVLRRVSSAVTKRQNSLEHLPDKTDSTQEKRPSPLLRSEISVERKDNKTSFDGSSGQLDRNSDIIMEGWLYRRKRMKLGKMWGVLRSEKKLYFYKNEEYSQKFDPTLVLDLTNGCDVQNVTQGKDKNQFTLIPNSVVKQAVSCNTILSDNAMPIQKMSSNQVHLMCKSTQEFVHWMKAFVVLNSTSGSSVSTELFHPVRTLNPIQRNLQRSQENMENPRTTNVELNNNVCKNFPEKFLAVHSPILCKSQSLNAGLNEIEANTATSGRIKSFTRSGNTTIESDEEVKVLARPTSTGSLKNCLKQGGEDTNVTNQMMNPDFKLMPKKFGKLSLRYIDDEVDTATMATHIIATETLSDNNVTNVGCGSSRWQCAANNNDQVTRASTLHAEGRGPKRERWLQNLQTGSKAEPSLEHNELLPSLLPFSEQSNIHNTSCGDADSTIPLDNRNYQLESVKKSEKRKSNIADRITLFEAQGGLASNCNQSIQVNTSAANKSSINSVSLSQGFSKKYFDDSSVQGNINKSGDTFSVADDKCFLKTEIVFNKAYSEQGDDKFVRSEVFPLRKSYSDSNLLEPSSDSGYRMRLIKKSVPELSKIDFIEVYGLSPGTNTEMNYKGVSLIKNNILPTTAIQENQDTPRSNSSTSNQDFTISVSSDGSVGGSKVDEFLSSNEASTFHPKKTSGSGSATSDNSIRDEKSLNWLTNVTPRIRRGMQRSVKTKSSKEQVFHIPASQHTSASHCGYLDRRDKKKQWERFWCVFQDSCLYCYNSPQSDVTRDVVVLRGYGIIADVTNMNRDRFVFRLVQEGFPNLYFSTDNQQDFLLWVGSLEKETRNIPTYNSDDAKSASVSRRQSSDVPLTPASGIDGMDESSALSKSTANERLEQEIVRMQKQKLLKQLKSQQQQLLLEQKILDGQIDDDVIVPPFESYPHSGGISKRDHVIEKYERVFQEEEKKATKSMALLNRRRNSAQIKVDQLAKDIAPKSGKKRRQNHQQFAAFEAKLTEMKEKLQTIDNEIHELQANKQNAFEKIRERQDLELLVTEQQESIDIIRRHENNKTVLPLRKRLDATTSRQTLDSIDEQFNTSTDSTPESIGSKIKALALGKSITKPNNPFTTSNITSREASCSSEDAHYFPADAHTAVDGKQTFSRVRDNMSSMSLSSSSLSRSQSEESLLSEKQSNKLQEVDASIMAGIEAFEEFSKQFLEKSRLK